MYRASLAHHQELLHKQHVVYCVHVMLVGYSRKGVEMVQSTDITCMQYTRCHCSAAPEDEQVMLKHVEALNS
jgi:hypothetical protein